jgi:DNA repair protein RadD
MIWCCLGTQQTDRHQPSFEGSTVQLRPYQEAALDALFGYLADEGGSPLVDLATGTGKSLVMAELARRVIHDYPERRVMVITHVKELIEQNYREFCNLWTAPSPAPAGIHSAGLGRKETRQQVIFAGIQTAHRKAASFGKIDLLLVDEAHLIPVKTETMYGRFIAEMRELNPDIRIAGLTATPYRLTTGRLDQGEGALFDEIIFTYGMRDAVRDGYLSRLITKATETGFDLTGVGKIGGEYIETQLQAAVDKTETTRRAVDEAAAFGRDRKSWLAFCSGVEHARHVRDEIRLRGFVAETVTGETPSEERRRILEGFKAGRIRCVTNNSVLTTGFNAPGVDMILAMRPTTSPGLYVQMMGRGTRNAPGKTNCLVLDFARLISTHGPVDDVKPRDRSNGGGVAPMKACPNCMSMMYSSIMLCPDCGHVFPASETPKLTPKASALAIMSDVEPEWIPVGGRTFDLHYKPDKPTSVIAKFTSGFVTHKAWYCPAHEGRARKAAWKFWSDHGGALPFPRDADEWIARAGELRPTASISVKPDGKYIAVVGARALDLSADVRHKHEIDPQTGVAA